MCNNIFFLKAPEKPTGLQMKLTSESSIIVTWNHQVADWFTLNLTSNTHSYQQNYITENSYTFTVISASSQYHLQMQAVFDERLSLLSDVITIDGMVLLSILGVDYNIMGINVPKHLIYQYLLYPVYLYLGIIKCLYFMYSWIDAFYVCIINHYS